MYVTWPCMPSHLDLDRRLSRPSTLDLVWDLDSILDGPFPFPVIGDLELWLNLLSLDLGISDLNLVWGEPPDRSLCLPSCWHLTAGEAASSLDVDLDDLPTGDLDFPPLDLDLSPGLRDRWLVCLWCFFECFLCFFFFFFLVKRIFVDEFFYIYSQNI